MPFLRWLVVKSSFFPPEIFLSIFFQKGVDKKKKHLIFVTFLKKKKSPSGVFTKIVFIWFFGVIQGATDYSVGALFFCIAFIFRDISSLCGALSSPFFSDVPIPCPFSFSLPSLFF
jgi:hypothetical protein